MNKQLKFATNLGIEWKPIPGMDGYFASSNGEIGTAWIPLRKGGRRKNDAPRPMRQVINNHGYATVNCKPVETDKRTIITVHSLIARTFIGERPAGLQIRHLNGIKTDNCVENLAYGTAAENAADKHVHGTTAKGESINTAILTEDDVFEIRRIIKLEGLGRDISNVDLAKAFGVSPSTIGLIAKGKIWKHVEVFI